MKGSRNTFLLMLALTLAVGIGLVVFFVRSNPDSLETYIAQLKQLLQSKKKDLTTLVASRPEIDREIIYKYRLVRVSASGGLQDLNSTDKYVEETSLAQAGLELRPDQVSHYQAYVTPEDPAVQAVTRGKSYEALYQEAVAWAWVEDAVLHGVPEKWLSPNYFLTQSPNLAGNPLTGSVASDCEEQAYTLVSALRAAGMPPENVRVVTGQVNFGGSIGGHAWVEVFDQSSNGWFQLDPTSGNYYDSGSRTYIESRGLPYTFFKTYLYPSVQIWTYFNDRYFWDNNRQQGNVAENWLTTETVTSQAPQSQVIYELPDNIRSIREERIRKLQKEIENVDEQELLNQLKQLQRERRQQEDQADRQEQSSQESSEQSQKTVIQEQQGMVVVVGRVEKVEPETITVKTRFGSLTVAFSSDTVVNGSSPGNSEAIERGLVILVEGEVDSEGRIGAKAIQIISDSR